MTSPTPGTGPVLDLHGDLVALFRAVCDVPSVSGDERALADAVEAALRTVAHLEVVRDGDTVVARTALGRERRVVVAGHLDTVPLTVPPNLPTRVVGEGAHAEVWGRGTVDMKGGVAVALALAAELDAPAQDVTWVFYDNEEVAADLNGLGRLARTRPDLLEADFAVLGEPTSAGLEGGCNGTLRAEVRVPGVAAHSARSWTGTNAIHAAHEVLDRLAAYVPQEIEVDGLVYREGMNAVGITGGIAGNVVPDECVVTVNFRFAPSRSVAEAEQHVRDLFTGFAVTLTDAAPGARPGLDDPLAADFAAAVLGVTGGAPAPKYGWTDVARFAELGVPAVNFGPGDPLLAHKDDERCPVGQLALCRDALRAWLTATPAA
ncbi:succinyl-diaminopimelate desuccinylase [Cellulosimicrobium sp. XJ-DQ-B-000]|uniref:succinyl-diaminopimelate desuccinylase n=1 Tax=Cellulosimicrobium TaxID=157920 RepID=UPI00203D7403|nr:MULTISPECIES: succinyl-diaminopimelate desuccinylase [Cellulosimicrobium]MCM3534782.1 succinyl-diaminopimelate desuccinylase [Cellulosimicrobium funkei]MDQ8040754.1 succinyl-diaminopimelate desuccinylase [Cellulosimicrobium sp. XJ-DQ-B-000]